MRTVLLVLLTLVCLGCGGGSPSQSQDKAAVQKPAPIQPQIATTPVPTAPVQPANTVDSTAQATSQPQTAAPGDQQPDTVREVAKAGAGAQGRGYGGGIVTTPVAAYWNTRQRVEYEIKIPGAMRLFKAANDRNPTNDEFWKLIEENGVNLPTLPPGEKYVYDPKTGELMVEKPAPQ